MFPRTRRACGFAVLAAIAAGRIELHAAWFKGNTHAHTLMSDGDSSPEDVARWYQQHGYDFLFITDHNGVTDVAPLNQALGNGGKFLVIAGAAAAGSAGSRRSSSATGVVAITTRPVEIAGARQSAAGRTATG